MTLHVYTRPFQPATKYVVHASEKLRFTIRNKPRVLMRCFKCHELHWAKNMVVQVYYDGVYQWCAPGKGCKGDAYARRRARKARKHSRRRAAKARAPRAPARRVAER